MGMAHGEGEWVLGGAYIGGRVVALDTAEQCSIV